MKSVLRLVLFAGVLTSLDGVNGMIPEAKNAKPAQTTNVNEDWTQEEKEWGADRIFASIEERSLITQNSSSLLQGVRLFGLNKIGGKLEKLSNDLKDSLNPEGTGQFNKFSVFLVAKGYLRLFDLAGIDCLCLYPSRSVNKADFRSLFIAFKDLKDDYGYFVENSDLTHLAQSKSPFIQWILKDQEAVQDLRDMLSKDSELPWNESSWWNFCALRSQYSLGWPAPGKEPSK